MFCFKVFVMSNTSYIDMHHGRYKYDPDDPGAFIRMYLPPLEKINADYEKRKAEPSRYTEAIREKLLEERENVEN